MAKFTNDVFHIGKDERVCCYYCQKAGTHTDYGHRAAFLAGAGHSPCDGNANYICRNHLDDDAVIYESFETPLQEQLYWADCHANDLTIAEHNRTWFANEAARIRTALAAL